MAGPDPAAIAVRHPGSTHRIRDPDAAELIRLFPAAVAVQLFGPSHLGRYITLADADTAVAVVLRSQPIAKAVALQALALCPRAIRPPKLGLLVVLQPDRGHIAPAPAGLEPKTADEHIGLAAPVKLFDAVKPVALGVHHPLAGANTKVGGSVLGAQAQAHVALVELHQHLAFVKLVKGQIGALIQPDRGRADAQADARTLVSAQAVALGDGLVARHPCPFFGLGVEQPSLANHLGDTGDAGRWVVRLRGSWSGQANQQAQRKQQAE